MRRDVREAESTSLLTHADSMLYGEFMARYRKLIEELQRQLVADSHSLNALNTEREKLRSAHDRFRELDDIAQPKQERINIVAAMLLGGVKQTERIRKNTPALASDGDFDMHDYEYIPVSAERLDPSQYPLWKVIREIVRHSGEIQVVKIQNALKDFSIKTKRQSIESALAVHQREFKITRRGREKFVSLK